MPPPTSDATSSPSESPAPPAFELAFDVGHVQAQGVHGRVANGLTRRPAAAVVATLTELYTIGFVDPAAWGDGAFPSLGTLFTAAARPEGGRALRSLTLGAAARELEAVRPRRARADLRFLADANDRPVVATADVTFKGIGLAGDDRRPIRHDGRYTLRRVNGRWRIVAYEVRARTVGKPTAGGFVPGLPERRARFVLAIGSDARPGQSLAGTRADAIQIVGVDPRTGRASILGIPRDSWVSFPGGGSNKINAALARGGPEFLVATVEQLTGITFDAYVLTGFAGFRALVKAMGGVEIRIPFPIHDQNADARISAGQTRLNARQALAFTRVRKVLRDGDFGRSRNQGRFIVAALGALRRQVAARGSAALIPWAVAGARHLQTNLSVSDIFHLLLSASAFEPGRVRTDVASGRVGNVGGLSVVFLDGAAHAQFRDLARDGLLGG